MTIVGIDIGGTTCGVVRADDHGRLETEVTFTTADPETTLARIASSVCACQPGPEPRFGIACGGPLDAAAGVILAPPNLPGWDAVPIVEFLQREFGGTAHLMNDANAGALAEWRFGAGRGARNVVFLTFGTGIGAGIIAEGCLLEGAAGNAGEIGHVRLTDHGPMGHGKPGSIEGWCSGGGLARRIADAITDGSLPADWPHRDARSLITAARDGEAEAAAIIADMGRYLGRSIAVILDLLNPEVVILGSLYVRAQDLLEGPMRETLACEALPASLASCTIVPAALGESLGAHQAIAVALHHRNSPAATVSLGTSDTAVIAGCLDDLIERHPRLASCRSDTAAVIALLATGLRAGGTLLLCGNGGSAADAEHWSGELLKGFEHKRAWPEAGPERWRRDLDPGLRAIPLTGFTSLRSAVANDLGAEHEYAQLVATLGTANDIFIGISTSGNAANVCAAATVARDRGLRVVALTGEAGGELARLADAAIRVPATRTADVQELHLPIYHTISRVLEEILFAHEQDLLASSHPR